jgi:hypothetical protein
MPEAFTIMPEGPGPSTTTRTESAVGEVRRVPLTALKVDEVVQQRVGGTAKKLVAEYAEAMRGGAPFPPPVVFSESGDEYHLADGFHRVAAHRLAHPDKQEIECDVHPGTREDAFLFACGANSSHGSPRTKADKRKSVLSLLSIPKYAARSDREIARLCKVSHPFVAKIRGEQVETFPPVGRKEAHQAAGIPAPADVGSTDTPAVTPNRRRTGKRGPKPHAKKKERTGSSRAVPGQNKPEPFLTAFGWSMATEPERVNFVNRVGAPEIVDALKAIEPALDLLNIVWKATGLAERQTFAKAHHEEINALAKAPGPTRRAVQVLALESLSAQTIAKEG